MPGSLGKNYNPLLFLASLGPGGLSVAFFMYPMFMIEHADAPLVTFDHIYPLLTGDNTPLILLLVLDLLAILVFALFHYYLLIWNIRAFREFKKTETYTRLKQSNAEASLMVIPLTLAMSINVTFVLGALFVPGLWSVVEYLFPFALAGFLAVGIYALRLLGNYFTRLLVTGDFDFVTNNNLSQMIPIFALTMIAVGFAAPGAMSHFKIINAIGIFLAIFFLSLAILLSILKLVLGFQSILKHGIAEMASPSLWIMIPILTLGGITIIRLTMGLHHGFETDLSKPGFFILTSTILSLQILVGMIGYSVMKRVGYFKNYVNGDKSDAGSFALICPGVAFFVFGMFFLTFGLVKNDLIEPLSVAYFLLLAPFILVQIKTVSLYFRLLCRVMGFGLCQLRFNPQG